MGVFFQFLHHHFPGIFKQIDGTPFLGTLESQLAKLGLGVDTFNELVGMKGARFVEEVVQLGLHLIQVLVVSCFGGQRGGNRPFLDTLFLSLSGSLPSTR